MGRNSIKKKVLTGLRKKSKTKLRKKIVKLRHESGQFEQAREAIHLEVINGKNYLQAVMKALPAGVAIFDKKSGSIHSNAAFKRVWGGARFSPHNIRDYAEYKAWWGNTGKPVKPEDWASAQAINKGKTITNQLFEIRRFDGSQVFVLNSASPLRDSNDKIIGCTVAIRDITKLHRFEKALRREQNFSSAVLDTAGMIVVVLDKKGRILRFNKECEEITGYSAKEVLGRIFWEFLIPREELAGVKKIWKTLWAGDFPNKHENHWVAKDGLRRFIEWSNTAMLNSQGDIEHIIGTGIDVTEQRQAEDELRRSREDLNRAQAVGKVGSWRLDVQKNILTWSDQNHLIFGIPKGTPMTYETFLSRVHPEDRDYVNKKWKAGLAGADYDIEHRLLVDGRVKWVREKAYLEFDDKGELLGGFGITQDITDRKDSEREIKNLARFPAENPFPILRILRDGTIQYSNAPGIAILDKWGCHVGQKAPDEWCKWAVKSLNSDRITIKGITCGDRIFSIAVTPITEAGYVNLYGRDITKQKQYEKELRNSRDELEIKVKQRTVELNQTIKTLQEEVVQRLAAEELVKTERQRFEDLLEMMPAYAILLTPDYHVVYANRTFREWFGDDNGKKCYEFLFNRTEPCENCETYTVLKTGKSHFWEWIGPNGRSYDIFDYPFKDIDGSTLIMEIGVDVTAHKQVQKALEQSEDRYRSLAIATTQIIWTTDAQGQVVGDMPSWRAFTGQSIEEIQGWGWINFLHPDDRERTAKIWTKSVKDKELYETEYRIRRQDGQYRYVSVRGVPVLEPDGSIREWVGTCTDISERKQIEEKTRITNILLELFAQKDSRKKYLDSVVEAIKDWSNCECVGIRLTNGDGYIPFESYCGFSDEFIASENMLSLKSDNCLCIRAITQKRESPDIPLATPKGSFCSGNTLEFVNKLLGNAKKLYRGICMKHGFASLAVIPIRYRQKILGAIHLADEKKDMVGLEKVEFLESMAILIGEAVHRFDVETELRKSESRLSEAQRIAHLGNWEWDITKGKLWWSDEAYRIFGLEPQKFDATYEAFLSYVHPDDRQAVKEAVDKALSHEGQYEIDHRVIRPDGAECVVHEQAEIVYDENHNPIKMRGTVLDITEQKAKENEIIDSQKKLRTLTSQLQLAEEQERRRLARDLHDSIGQILAFSSMTIKFLQKNSSRETAMSLAEVSKQLDLAVQQARTLSFDLSPSVLYDFGLETAIEDLVDTFARERKIQCYFKNCQNPKPLTDDVKVLLYRSVRELLINTVKHAIANTINVSLLRSSSDIYITVEDNGKGFDTSVLGLDSRKAKGFGIFSIRERLNHIGGQMKIESANGKGTKITLIAPLNLDKENQ